MEMKHIKYVKVETRGRGGNIVFFFFLFVSVCRDLDLFTAVLLQCLTPNPPSTQPPPPAALPAHMHTAFAPPSPPFAFQSAF